MILEFEKADIVIMPTLKTSKRFLIEEAVPCEITLAVPRSDRNIIRSNDCEYHPLNSNFSREEILGSSIRTIAREICSFGILFNLTYALSQKGPKKVDARFFCLQLPSHYHRFK